MDIDSLDSYTLHQLHNYIHPKAPKLNTKAKRQRIHYSERDADKKIHELEATLKKFNSNNAHYGKYMKIHVHVYYHLTNYFALDSSSSSSGSEDDEGSSGSDSE